MAELQAYSVNLGQTETPTPPATTGDVKAQTVRMADVFVFGPLMLMAAFDRKPPKWLRAGMIIVGVGTILYNLANYLEVEKRQRAAGVANGGELGQMNWGPMHRASADLHRPINLVQRVARR